MFAFLLALHLRHAGVLWEGDSLPLAAALQMKRGSVLYREIWFDKPPLVAAVYLLWGAKAGTALRIAGAVYAWIACLLAYALAAGKGMRGEGYWAAGLLGFFLTFDTHSAVLPLAADMLLLVPHLAAVLLALRKQAFWSGVAAGIGFLFNAKAVFVLAACAIFVLPGAWTQALLLLAGFLLPNLAALGWIAGTGALTPYLDQAWRWPARYAASPVVPDPVWNGVVRTLGWLGFHAVLVIGALIFWLRRGTGKTTGRYLAWAVICYAGVVLGWRFFPRYFLLLLAPLTIMAARGLTCLRSRAAVAIAVAAMAVPLVRFAPRYVSLTNWNDLALDRDSREASRIALGLAKEQAPAEGSLFVWGYRPEDYVYTGLRPATRFLDSQAMTGVPADRHLTQSDVVLTAGTQEARAELARSRPDVVIDGLSLYNPALAMDHYAQLRPWLAQYREAGRTRGSIIYVRRAGASARLTTIKR